MQSAGGSANALRTARRQSAGTIAHRAHRRRSASAPKAVAEFGFGYLAALCDFCTIVLAGGAASGIYNFAARGLLPDVEPVTEVSVVVGALVVILNLQRNEYAIRQFDSFSGHVARSAAVWNIAFFCALALGFATKTTELFSRGATGVLYVVGLVTLCGGRAAMVNLLAATRRRGLLPRHRLVVVGFESQLAAFIARYDLSDSGMEIVAAAVLRDGEEHLSDDLALAAATVRVLRPDEIVVRGAARTVAASRRDRRQDAPRHRPAAAATSPCRA